MKRLITSVREYGNLGLWCLIIAGPLFNPSNFGAIDRIGGVGTVWVPYSSAYLVFGAVALGIWIFSKKRGLPDEKVISWKWRLKHLPLFAVPAYCLVSITLTYLAKG